MTDILTQQFIAGLKVKSRPLSALGTTDITYDIKKTKVDVKIRKGIYPVWNSGSRILLMITQTHDPVFRQAGLKGVEFSKLYTRKTSSFSEFKC